MAFFNGAIRTNREETVIAPSLKEIETAFQQAVELSPTEQQQFLETLKAGNPELGLQVERLLAADRLDDDVLNQPVMQSAEDLARLTDDRWIGQTLGVFHIESRIASGGMGAVFLARRTDDAFQQRVAIKIMGAHMLSADAVSRFRAERQILANLKHPYIAQLLDGGTTTDGLPYLVMEFIEGRPIDEFAERERLSVNDRLRLFGKVCEAVDYAHRNLIVHRDLKPSNILVDNEGNPKLLDFGIAKLLSDTGDPTMTQVGDRVMTLQFASPEQVRGSTISVASDVYALGVLLYHLLTGQSPYGSASRSVRDMETAILESEPRRPSTVVSATATESGGTSYRIDPERVRRQLSGDLDNIVLMAIRKEAERRYGSVREFGDDIRNHLSNRPVTAHRSTWSYRASKFFLRNRIAVTSVTLSLLAIIGVTAAFTLRLASERDLAQRERSVAESVSDFLVETFKVSDPFENPGGSITAREILERGSERLNLELAEAPVVKARISRVLGQVYYGLGLYERAVDLAEQSISIANSLPDADALEILDAKELLGNAHTYLGNYALARELFEEVVRERTRLLGAGHQATINAIANLGDLQGRLSNPQQQLDTCLPALPQARQLTSVAEKTWLMICVAAARESLGDQEAALALYEEAARLQLAAWGPESPTYLDTINNQALALWETTGGRQDAIRLLSEVLETRRRVLGPNHRHVLEALHNRGSFQVSLNELEAGQQDIEEALAIIEASAQDHSDMHARLLYLMGRIRYAQAEFDVAIDFAGRAAAMYQDDRDTANLELASAYNLIGGAHSSLGRFEVAEQFLSQGLAETEKAFEPNHPEVVSALDALGTLHMQSRNYDKAVEIEQEAVRRARLFGNSRTTVTSEILLSKALAGANRQQEALDLIIEIRDAVKSEYGEDSAEYGVLIGSQADAEFGLNRHEQSIRSRREAIELLTRSIAENHPVVAVQLYSMARSHEALGDLESARRLGQQAWQIFSSALGPEHSTAQAAQALLDRLPAP